MNTFKARKYRNLPHYSSVKGSRGTVVNRARHSLHKWRITYTVSLVLYFCLKHQSSVLKMLKEYYTDLTLKINSDLMQIKKQTNKPVLGTLVLWISISMLDLDHFIIWKLI